MAEYTLYIDESETFNSSGKKYFVMSGVIIKETNYLAIQSEIKALKIDLDLRYCLENSD